MPSVLGQSSQVGADTVPLSVVAKVVIAGHRFRITFIMVDAGCEGIDHERNDASGVGSRAVRAMVSI